VYRNDWRGARRRKENVPFISITRLRVRSVFYLPQFMWYAMRSSRQAARAPGFLGGKVLRDERNAFWTVTAWRDDAAMNAYRTGGSHAAAMPKLLEWCDEASVAHWTQDTPELPSWQEAYERMVKEGRASKVKRPSAAHLAYKFPPPPGRVEAPIRPAPRS